MRERIDKQQMSYLMDSIKRIDLKMFVEREVGVSLESKGSGKWMGVCPLHGDSNPSFSVTLLNDGVWVYKCFGCQSSGTIIDFCMEKFDISNAWKAAVEIAKKEGIQCDSSIIVKATQEAKVQTDRQRDIDMAHFSTSCAGRKLLSECGGDEETMTWVAKQYTKMNSLLDDQDASSSPFDLIDREIKRMRLKIIERATETVPV